MPGPGWPLRLAIGVLFVVLVLVAVELGWMQPGLFFYVATSVVGLLVWLDYEFNRKESRDDRDEDLIEPTLPDFHKGGGSALRSSRENRRRLCALADTRYCMLRGPTSSTLTQ